MSELETTGETTDALTAESTGRWLVTTEHSRHIWDLDQMTYTRFPEYPRLSGAALTHQERHTRGELPAVRTQPLQEAADVGSTGTKDMLRMIARPVPTDEGTLPGLSARRTLSFGGHPRTLRLIHYDEADPLLNRLPGTAVEYCTAWDSPTATRMLSALRRTGLLQRLAAGGLPLRPRHSPGKPETVLLTAEAHGTLRGRRASPWRRSATTGPQRRSPRRSCGRRSSPARCPTGFRPSWII